MTELVGVWQKGLRQVPVRLREWVSVVCLCKMGEKEKREMHLGQTATCNVSVVAGS